MFWVFNLVNRLIWYGWPDMCLRCLKISTIGTGRVAIHRPRGPAKSSALGRLPSKNCAGSSWWSGWDISLHAWKSCLVATSSSITTSVWEVTKKGERSTISLQKSWLGIRMASIQPRVVFKWLSGLHTRGVRPKMIQTTWCLGCSIQNSYNSEHCMKKNNWRCAGCVVLRAGWGRGWRIGRWDKRHPAKKGKPCFTHTFPSWFVHQKCEGAWQHPASSGQGEWA